MLNTVLEIGRVLRDPDDREEALPHHRYVERCPMGEEDEVLRVRIPVTEDFDIDLDEISVIRNERLFEELLYLKYRTSENDSTMKYMFGDILYTREDGGDGEYYRLSKEDKKGFHGKGSFDRGRSDAQDFIVSEQEILKEAGDQKSKIQQFRNALNSSDQGAEVRKIDLLERMMRYQAGVGRIVEQGKEIDKDLLRNEDLLRKTAARDKFAKVKSGRGSSTTFEGLLGYPEPEWQDVEDSEEALEALAGRSSGQIFLHFDIQGHHWYECESAMTAIDRQFVSAFAKSSIEGEYDGAVLMKQMYKAIASPNASLQFPEFTAENQNRVRLFDEEELMDLFYAIEMAGEAKHVTQNVKIVVLPRGENMTAEDISRFMGDARSLEEISDQEKEFRGGMHRDDQQSVDQVLDSVLAEATGDIVEFDLVFSELDPKGDHDLVELSGVSRSFLKKVRERIKDARDEVTEKYEEKMGHELEDLNIYRAFRELLSGVGQDQPRYQRHLYRMLPKIYSETYYQDPLLLPALIEQTERAVRGSQDREEDPYFTFNRLDHYLQFLTRIQNSQDNRVMQNVNPESYELGHSLGRMAVPLNRKIGSFEKNYVGNLRRRVATLEDLIEFKNELDEMLVRHERGHKSEIQESREKLYDTLESLDESFRLDKNDCALGFFRGYFSPSDGGNGNG